MNSKELEARIKELEAKRDHSSILNTSKEAGDFMSSVQNGMYWGQLAMTLFQTFGRGGFSFKKKAKRAVILTAISIGVTLALQAYREFRSKEDQ